MIDMNNLITEPFIRDAKCQASKETDLENGRQVLQSNSDFGMEEFNKQIQEAEIQVDKLSGLLINLKTLLRDANEESKSVTKSSEIEAIKKRVKYIDDVGKIAHNVRGKLQVITIDNLLLRHMPGCQKGTASDRARMSMTNVLTKRLMELMIDFETLRQTIQDKYCEDVDERRVITVTGTRPDESMIDYLIETGNSDQIFQNAFEQMGQGKVISSVKEIQEQLDAVKEIEKRLSELHQIYLKTAVLLEEQAKILDNIENQVTNAEDHFRSRIDAIQRAKSLQKKSRKYMMISIILLLVIVITTVLSV